MTNSEHGKPLAPGEIRTHVVGDRAFQVMHVSGGSFTQATYRDGVDGPTQVICTHRFETNAVHAYAGAIAAAEEALAAGQGDFDPFPAGGDGLTYTANRPQGLGPVPQDRSADGVPEVGQAHAASGRYASPVGGMAQLGPELDAMRADAAHYASKAPAPMPADDVAALRAILARDRPSLHRDDILARLDRIAARVPQRVGGTDARPMWWHPCGMTRASDEAPRDCSWCYDHGTPWRPLYVLPDGA